MKYYLIKLLTNTAGQDGSTVTDFVPKETESDKDVKERALVAYHQTLANFYNAADVLYAVVQIQTESGGVETVEIVDHRPEPEPETEE